MKVQMKSSDLELTVMKVTGLWSLGSIFYFFRININ